MKIYCVCKCGEHSSDEATMEINFRNNTIYFVCPKCKKEYTMEMKPPAVPLPRIGRIR